MIASNLLLDRLATILSTDTGSLAPAAGGVKVHLASAPFNPAPSLLLAGLTEATFQGYAALLAATGAQMEFVDPVTGNRVVQLQEPAGGWHWATTGAVGLPMTIYGIYVTDNGVTVLYGSQLFSTPVVLTASGQGIDQGQVRFQLAPPTIS